MAVETSPLTFRAKNCRRDLGLFSESRVDRVADLSGLKLRFRDEPPWTAQTLLRESNEFSV